jgi:segregation and condensation protein A
MAISQKSGHDTPLEAIWEYKPDQAAGDPTFLIDVEGFEGPLDLLLHLARNQKVDLARISVLALAEQYLAFVEKARQIRLELAADYLVMAAWLAYLKSKLLLPKPANEAEGQSGEEMAALLQFRLKRLEAMREAASRLINGNLLGRDVMARGMPEAVIVDRKAQYAATLYDLLTAYAAQRQRQAISRVAIEQRSVWSLKDARRVLERMLGRIAEWTALDRFLIDYLAKPEERATAIASSFAVTLELVREGELDIRQDGAFSPLYLRNAVRKAAGPNEGRAP